ncbi:matrixin family metalloprotease [Actinomadura rudentiformis]|uniref:matrixin family metalloprotease n=1 Tax=Actinomadura rudentiformis TaxID=359158 RepID=UPI001CEF99F7|nr:matrixin family metalloprotease [Actinomadura rudentiformis]
MTSPLLQLSQRQATCFVAIVGLGFLSSVPVASIAAGSVAAANLAPSWCKGGGPLDAQSLPSSVNMGECDLRSRVIQGQHGVRVEVPPRGSDVVAVTAHALQANGGSALTVRVTPDQRTISIDQQSLGYVNGRPWNSSVPEGACRDSSFSAGLSSWKKGGTIEWKFAKGPDVTGVPNEKSVVTDGVTRAVTASTDCTTKRHFEPQPNIRERFAGTTTSAPNINAGACSKRDGTNAIGWANMTDIETGTLALSCTWQTWRNIIEGDIALQNHGKDWWVPSRADRADSNAVSACPAGSFNATSAVVHEMLHVLGLKHVRGKKHSSLTMAPTMKPCDDGPATLGLGDYRGLIALYGSRP